MYDAFTPRPSNGAPFTALPAGWDLLEVNQPLAGAAARRVRHGRLNMDEQGAIPQQQLDAELWRSVHGQRSTPPPPGPNGEPGQ